CARNDYGSTYDFDVW
nr:immunoglobulin heavy chain junction region [Mus musculus]NSM04237.1 immunoglobulin heavy chain junction region [Mus musculus]NSM04792.1 immunoglobulin heavy chain junction region [Mus musculus]NSM06379.1 immunoglobulin heavy chain junction region [Mus musculus]NSM06553.1 immunoglobulin heavy chain junction region [Mus musculus]